MNYISRCPTPLGELLLASDGECLTGAWFSGQKYYARGLSPDAREADLPIFQEAQRWLNAYFSGRDPGPLPPIRLTGTEFQAAVWALLQQIPQGETRTYGQLAAALARQRGLPSMSAQAVGGAVGRNPLSVFVPCHRVVGADGSLTGYAGGMERKRALLILEGALDE